MLVSEPIELLGNVIELPIFVSNGCFEGLVLFVVEINRHLDLLLSVNFVLLVVINNLLLLAIRSFDLFVQLPDSILKVILLLLLQMLGILDNGLHLPL